MYELLVRAIVVVLDVAGLGALAAADADAQVERVAELDALRRGGRSLDGHVAAVLRLRVSASRSREDRRQLVAASAPCSASGGTHRRVRSCVHSRERRHRVARRRRRRAWPPSTLSVTARRSTLSLMVRSELGGSPSAAAIARRQHRMRRPRTSARADRGSRRSGCAAVVLARDPSGRSCRRARRAGSRGTAARGTARTASSPRVIGSGSPVGEVERACAARPGDVARAQASVAVAERRPWWNSFSSLGPSGQRASASRSEWQRDARDADGPAERVLLVGLDRA